MRCARIGFGLLTMLSLLDHYRASAQQRRTTEAKVCVTSSENQRPDVLEWHRLQPVPPIWRPRVRNKRSGIPPEFRDDTKKRNSDQVALIPRPGAIYDLRRD